MKEKLRKFILEKNWKEFSYCFKRMQQKKYEKGRMGWMKRKRDKKREN